MKPPAFQFYPDNFRDGVADFSQEEIGAYMMLLCYQWSHGAIPKDRARMERAACGPVSDHVLRKFPLSQDGELRNERLEREREKQTAYRESRAINGAKGGRPKAHGLHMVLKTEPKHEAKKSSPSPSPSPSPSSSSSPSPSPSARESLPAEARPHEFERPTQSEFVDFMTKNANVPPDYAADRWGRYDSSGWIAGNGRPIAKWRSLAPSLQAQYRSDFAKAQTWSKNGKPPRKSEAERDAERTGLPGYTGNLKRL